MQKAAKTLAARNNLLLRRNHLITIALHLLFLLFQLLLVRRRSWLLYFIFCAPAVAVEIYLDVIVDRSTATMAFCDGPARIWMPRA